MHITAIVPARNEAATVGRVVRAARASPLIDDVIVVDGASTDDTGRRAAAAGARVIQPGGPGKGAAMLAGLRATDAEVLVFLDGDLTGLAPHHVDRLARTVASGDAVMACGLFDRGPMINTLWLHLPPILTGERAVRRELLEALTADDVAGYRVEAALNCRAGDVGGPIAAFVCRGMFHNTKEKKFQDPLRGSVAKARMFATAYTSFLRYRLRYGWRARAQPAHRLSTTSPQRSVVDHSGDNDGAASRTPLRSSSQRSRG